MRTSLLRQRASNVPSLRGTKHYRVYLCSTFDFHYGKDLSLGRVCWNPTTQNKKQQLLQQQRGIILIKIVNRQIWTVHCDIVQVAIGKACYVIFVIWTTSVRGRKSLNSFSFDGVMWHFWVVLEGPAAEASAAQRSDHSLPVDYPKPLCLCFTVIIRGEGSIPSWTCFPWLYVMSLLQRNNTAWLLNTRLNEITFNSEARKSIRHQFEVMQVTCAKACASGFEDNWFVIKGMESCSVHSMGLQIFARSDPSHKCAKWIS